MAVNSMVLKRILKECCRSLSYNDEERQFAFMLKPCLGTIWERLKSDIWTESPDFYLSDFNKLLERLSDQRNLFTRIEVEGVSDRILLNGEVLEVFFVEDSYPLRLVKMKNGQYLSAACGKGYSFGNKIEFVRNGSLRTSEGTDLGTIKSVTLLSPSCEHIVLSKLFIGNYYRNRIPDSVWPVFDKAVKDGVPRYDTDLSEFLSMSKVMGINSFSLLNILNAAVNVWK